MIIHDDPLIRHMQKTGYPPWFDNMCEESGDEEEDRSEKAERRSKWRITEKYAGQRQM